MTWVSRTEDLHYERPCSCSCMWYGISFTGRHQCDSTSSALATATLCFSRFPTKGGRGLRSPKKTDSSMLKSLSYRSRVDFFTGTARPLARLAPSPKSKDGTGSKRRSFMSADNLESSRSGTTSKRYTYMLFSLVMAPPSYSMTLY